MKETVIARRKDYKKEFVNGVSHKEILENSYKDVQVYYTVLQAGTTWNPEKYAFEDKCQFFIFVKGTGYVTTKQWSYNIKEAGVFVPNFDRENFGIYAAEELECVHIIANMSEYDIKDMKAGAISLPRFRLMSEGWTYDEDFKAPGTKSCMLVEHRNLGRFSTGATFGKGPSCNGTHTHPDLEQWYIVLPGSKFTYTSGGDTTIMTEGDVSYTPHGVAHSSESFAGEQLDYIWFELCEDGYVGE